jgi:amino acid adenylation domain-containing protein/thioester reductase-like protein
MKRLRPDDDGILGCGRPLANTSVHICDAQGSPVPPGVIGELWLGGAGLARGYVGRPDLTAAAFVETARGRRYRSGDRARWRVTGELELLGRIDDQVKLNGIRIELGEIEHALGSHPAVAQAVALLDGDAGGSQSLWAFVRPLPGKEAPTEERWRDHLADRLPSFMIPSAVIAVPSIPVSSSGKVDKAALRTLIAGRAPSGEGAAPLDGFEAGIARVWSELLGRGPVRREDNFFALGGHSLLAIAVANRLEKTLGHLVPARELFAAPTLGGFAHRVRQLSKAALPSGLSSDRATEGQRELWVAEQAGLDTRGFNLPLTLVARGNIPPAQQWRSAWAALVTRHEALRTNFHQGPDGELRRSALPELGEDLETSTQPDMPTALAQIRERQTQPFLMEHPPLWRAGLVRVTAADQAVFWLALHHSVGDGVSLGILAEELTTLLRGGSLQPMVGRFDDSAGLEESYLAGPACREDALYWRGILGGLGDGSPDVPQPFDEWLLDFPRPPGRTAHNAKGSHCFRLRLEASTAAGLRDFAQRNGASLHALMLTIMAQEVRRRTGRPEFLLGCAASTRDSASEARVVGYYVNLLPVPCRVRAGESVEQALRSMQRALAEGLLHARYPFACMSRDFRRDHALTLHPARFPLIDLVVTEDPGMPATSSSDERLFHFSGPSALPGDAARYDLRLNAPAQDMALVYESQPDGSLILRWYVNAAIHDKDTAEAWIDSLAGWARFLAEGKRLPGAALPALLPEEKDRLAGWERGPTLPHQAESLPALLEHWARVQPERPALITDHGAQSYADLDARANALGHALRAEGLARGEPVGVLTDRCAALPEAVLAIWKAGGCYLPLVKDLPAERLAFMARDAGVRLLLALDGNEPPALLAKACRRIFRPESLSQAFLSSHGDPLQLAGGAIAGSELAAIIYTSGSTGTPKGVLLHHQGLCNLGVGAVTALGVRSDDRALMMASPAFDLWLSDLLMAWTAGAALVPIQRRELDDIPGMREKLVRLSVSVASMTPSYLRLFEQADFPSLRVLMTVGEPPHRADVMHYAARLRYFNGYGPTETTAAASFGQIPAHAQRLTAGRPLPNTSIHIRDGKGESVPPGAVGILWLGGMGLSPGYLNRSDLTAASFVETPSGRLYCTGDLGRWSHTGELQVLGRSDGQVKLRGQRVELGEIEHRLEAHPAVRQGVALVEARADGAQVLWALVCLHSGAPEPTQAQWHDHLSATLPSSMRPSAVLRVPDIPVSTTGKVDRAALLRVVSEHSANLAQAEGVDLRHTQPHDGTERRVAEVWSKHLERRSITREDNFFDLGGDSLRVISVANELRRSFQCTINDLYEHPRLADFAGACRPQPEHLRTLLHSAARHWQAYRRGLAAYEAERELALSAARRGYEQRNQSYRGVGAGERRSYARVLLTGATGYLGSYLLRELLADRERQVSVLVRGGDDRTARSRLGEVLCHYFGPHQGAALRDDPRLTVLAGDLRRDDLGLSPQAYERLADGLQAVFHCAANVKHFGHYRDFHADNVAATGRMLHLAGRRAASPADFHLVSTLSAGGAAPEHGFRLFTEYDAVPETLDDNYYIRSKQEAERRVIAARQHLANACIHRVGNLVFPAGGGPLQSNLEENAFFRQLSAFLRLGVVPDDAHLWLCHVDLVARGLLLLAGAADLTHETHHLENARRDTLAGFVAGAEGVRACSFDALLERLEAAVHEPEMESALAETLENFGLYRGVSPQARARRLEIVSERTQALLARMGLVWPPAPAAGRADMLRQASSARPTGSGERSQPLPRSNPK